MNLSTPVASASAAVLYKVVTPVASAAVRYKVVVLFLFIYCLLLLSSFVKCFLCVFGPCFVMPFLGLQSSR